MKTVTSIAPAYPHTLIKKRRKGIYEAQRDFDSREKTSDVIHSLEP